MNDTIFAPATSCLDEGLVFSIDSLVSYFSQLPDPRKRRGVRYSSLTLLTLLLLAKLGGEDTLKGISEWVQLRCDQLVRLLNLPREQMPHQTTYERFLSKLDVDAFEGMLSDFFTREHEAEQPITIIIDGKVLRGTIPTGGSQGVHLLAAYVPEQGAVLMQIEVDGKANEIVAAPRLLDALDLSGCVVTGDAMFTQRDLCEQIVLAGGDYLLPVKDNQPTLRRDIADAFMPAEVSPAHCPIELAHTTASCINNGHGRIEQRYITVTDQLNDYLDWPQVQQVFRLQRVVTHQNTGEVTYEVVFGVTSLAADTCPPERLLDLNRQHWHIENRLHYVRDVSFHEDACTVRETKRQRLLACFNNLAIGLIRRTHFAYIPEARRAFAADCTKALELMCS